ncbi:MAG: helix-turn-helix transcriptional regulator [Deltaproteobacteria bacterium]|nr:helix-turn-helix transcriptional regulator [Deltaproteobacteria bacterium]
MASLAREFGTRLRQAREACQFTQAELAERAALATEAYGRLERGLALPRVETLIRLARALGVSTDALLGVDALPLTAAQPAVRYKTPPASAERLARRVRAAQRRTERLVDELVAALSRRR